MSVESLIDTDYANAVDARLDSYDAYIDYQMQEARRALPFLARFIDVKNARVLEIGAGRGGKSITYALAGMRVTALDVDLDALILGGSAARARHADVRFLAGDGAQLPFADNHFDAILLDSVIEHVQNPTTVLRECRRALKSGGIVFIVFPPFYGPLSGHIDDYISVPWFHLLPRQVVQRRLWASNEVKGILTSRDAYAVFTTLNGLTVFQFKQAVRAAGLRIDYLRVRPFLTHPGMRLVAGLVTALRQPPRFGNLRAVFSRARREFTLGTFFLFLLLSGFAPLVFVPFVQEIAAGGCKAVLRKTQPS